MKIFVDAVGDVCPIPIVKTKNAIRTLNGADGTIVTSVDNEIAVQNLTKMARQLGYGVSSEKTAENRYQVTLTVGAGNAPSEPEVAVSADSDAAEAPSEPAVCIPDARKNTVVVIASDVMGGGDDALGAVLMKAFIFALSQQETLPRTILFYNGGARLTCEESPALEDLKSLEAQGVEILTCGTCLNHYNLTDQLKVGTVTNMYAIVEKQAQADLILRP